MWLEIPVRPSARLAFLTTRCEFRRRKKKLSWRRRRRRRPQHRFATKGSFPPSSFLPSLRRTRWVCRERGERHARARPASERPRLFVTGAPKGYVNRGGLRRARERDRARSRSRSGGGPLLGASQHGAAFCRFVNRPVRPAAAGRPAHRHPDAERRGRPEILKSRNQFSIINHIFCQTAEGGRERGRPAAPPR